MRLLALPLALVAVGVLVLGSPSGPKHAHTSCRSIFGVAIYCDAAAATQLSPAQRLGVMWEQTMNQYGIRHHGHVRIKHISCTAKNNVLHCRFALVDVVLNRVACVTARIAMNGRLIDQHPHHCLPAGPA